MRPTRATLLLAAWVLAGASGTPGQAQSGAPPAPPARWVYPRGGRDPLAPPAALYAGQSVPAIEVTLIGVDSHRPNAPLAVVRIDSRPPLRRVVRPGDRVGPYRILHIGAHGVRVAVPSFGGGSVLDLALGDSSSTR